MKKALIGSAVAAFAVAGLAAAVSASTPSVTLYALQEGVPVGELGGKLFNIDAGTLIAEFVYDPELAQQTRNQPNGLAIDGTEETLRLYFAAAPDPSRLSTVYFLDEGANHVFAGKAAGFIAGADMHDGIYYYINDLTDDLRAISFSDSGHIESDTIVHGGFTDGLVPQGYRLGDLAISCTGDLYVSAFHADFAQPKSVEFFSLDLDTGDYTLIKEHTADDAWELAFGTDGTLYGHDPSTGEFFTVDTATGDTTFLGLALGSDHGAFTDLASDPCQEPEMSDVNPRGLITQVRDNLVAELQFPKKKDRKELDKTIKDLDRSLNDDLWVSDFEITGDGRDFYKHQEKAAKSLNKVKGHDFEEELAMLVVAHDFLAQQAIDAAVAADGDSRKIRDAEKAIDKARREVDKGKIDKAIKKYEDALKKALQAT